MNARNRSRSRVFALCLGLLSWISASALDSPLIIEQTFQPPFPASLAFSPISEGTVRVLINVDSSGKLVDAMLVDYTHRAFADEALRAVRHWKYTPARDQAGPVAIRTTVVLSFESQGRVISLSPSDTLEALVFRGRSPDVIKVVCPPNELDAGLAPLTTVSPSNPVYSLHHDVSPGTVVVDFYIDETGRPRMPAIVSSPHDACSAAALDAIEQWRFRPPTRDGRPAAVRAQQRFIFPAKT